MLYSIIIICIGAIFLILCGIALSKQVGQEREDADARERLARICARKRASIGWADHRKLVSPYRFDR